MNQQQQIDIYIEKRQFRALMKYIETDKIIIDKSLADKVLERDSQEASSFYLRGGFQHEGFITRMFEYDPMNRHGNKEFLTQVSAKDIILNEKHDFVDTIRKAVECDAPGEAMVIALFAAKKNPELIPELNLEMKAFKETHPNTYRQYMSYVCK
jgi:hypothetical protein